jgi:TatA/E family protein of Tat protein translocase
MPSLGPAEILVILVIALLVFGPEKLPDIAKQVGKGMREFRRVQQHLSTELRDVVTEFDGSAETSVPPSGGGDPVPMLPPKDENDPGEPAVATSDDTAGDRGRRVWPPPASTTGA